MAAALPFIMAAGTTIAAIGTIQAGQAAKAAASRNAAVNERSALIARQQGEAAVKQQERMNVLRLGSATAAIGASGVRMEGSPLDFLESAAQQAELDVQNIRYSTELKALGFNENAEMDRERGSQAYRNSLWSAASTSLIGGSRAYGMRGAGTPVPVDSFAGADMSIG